MTMSAWLPEKPRQLTVPAPYGLASNKQRKSPDTIRALRDKLTDFQSENELLGNLVKDLKAERDALYKKVTISAKQLADAKNKAAAAAIQADTATKEQRRFQAEVDRLSSIVDGHSVHLEKCKQHQKDLEDVAIDLRAELDTTRAQLEAAEAAAQQAQQRCTAAEAKLVAAGLGSLPKMGPTAEQLIINSTQRIKELTEELSAVKSDSEQQMASMQQEVEQAKAAAQEAQQELKQQAHQQELLLRQQAGRLQASEQQCKQLQELLIGMQQKVAEGKVLAQAQEELQQIKQDMLQQGQSLQQQVCKLQGQLADAELKHATALSDSQQQLMAMQRQLAAVQREKQELTATLVAVRQQESGHRVSAGDASAKVERLRGELVRCVGELQVQLENAAAAGEQHRGVLQQLRALETTAAAAREEASETRRQLVELASVTMAELREQVASEFVALSELPGGVSESQLPLAVTTYIKALEHAICDCEQRCKQLQSDTITAQQQERQLRQELAAAREQQSAAQRALQQQTQRLLAAEKMRLADLRELQGLEKRLLLAQQECWNLRDTLLKTKSGEAGAALLSATASTTTSSQQQHAVVTASPAKHAAALAVQQDEQPQQKQQQQQQQLLPASNRRPPGGLSWAAGVSDAAAAGAVNQYQSKLEQLRQLKSQLKGIGRGKAAAATVSQAARMSKAPLWATHSQQLGTGDVADTLAAADETLQGRLHSAAGMNSSKAAAAAAPLIGHDSKVGTEADATPAATVGKIQSVRFRRSSSGSRNTVSGTQSDNKVADNAADGSSRPGDGACVVSDAVSAARQSAQEAVITQDERQSAAFRSDTSQSAVQQAHSTASGDECQQGFTSNLGQANVRETSVQNCATGSSTRQFSAAAAGGHLPGQGAAAASSVQEPEWQQQLKQWEQQRKRWQELETSGAFGLTDLPVAGDAAAAGHEPDERIEAWDSGVWRP